MVYAEKLEGGWYCASLVNTAEFYRPLKIILALLIILTLLEAFVFIAALYHLSSKNLAISIQNVQLGALGDMYMSIQDIDLATDSIRAIRREPEDKAGHGDSRCYRTHPGRLLCGAPSQHPVRRGGYLSLHPEQCPNK